jgi:hypothetical protein
MDFQKLKVVLSMEPFIIQTLLTATGICAFQLAEIDLEIDD